MSITEKLAARRATGINPPDAAKPVEPLGAAAPTFTPTVSSEAAALEYTTFKEAMARAAATPTDAPSSTCTDLILYVDCRPVKGAADVRSLDEEIAARSLPILAYWSKELRREVHDVREIDFGKGTAELFASFRRSPLTGAWATNANGLGGAVVEVLSPLASMVVRGGR